MIDGYRGRITWWAGVAGLTLFCSASLGPLDANAGHAATRLSTPEVTRGLVDRLKANGRVEVRIERLALDPISGRTRAVRGVLSLEPPNRAALSFPATGERITLRADGGEWLQPDLRQMIRLGAGEAIGVTRWWDLLMGPEPGQFTSRQLSPKRWMVFTAPQGDFADSAWITLAPDGLPSRIEVAEAPGPRAIYRFHEWTFMKPQGRVAFVIQPPPGYEVVRLSE